MNGPVDEGRGRSAPEPSADSNVTVAGDDEWGKLEERLAPLEALVPEQAPPWRATSLGAVAVLGVFGASLVSRLAVLGIEHLLFPANDAADFTHGAALGIAVAAWGVLSLAVLGGAARWMLGRAASLGRRDVVVAGVVLVLLAAWTTGLHAWVVGVVGYVELDLISRSTYVWPLIVVLVTVALVGVRFTRGRVTVVVLALAALAIVAISIETVRNASGAVADSEVSSAGIAVGLLSVAQIVVLCAWSAVIVWNRYGR